MNTQIETRRALDTAVENNSVVQIFMTHGIKGHEVFTGELVEYSETAATKYEKKREYVTVFGKYRSEDRKTIIKLRLNWCGELFMFERKAFIG